MNKMNKQFSTWLKETLILLELAERIGLSRQLQILFQD